MDIPKNFVAGRQYWISPLSQKSEQDFYQKNDGDNIIPQPTTLFRPLTLAGEYLISQHGVKTPQEFLEKMHNSFIGRNGLPTSKPIFFYEIDPTDMRTKKFMYYGTFSPFIPPAPPQQLSDGQLPSAAPAPAPQQYAPPQVQPYYAQPEAKSLRATNDVLTNENERLRGELKQTRESLNAQIEENQRIRSAAQSEKNEVISSNIETVRQLEILRGQSAVFEEKLAAHVDMAKKQAAQEKDWTIKTLTDDLTRKDAQIAELQEKLSSSQQQLSDMNPPPSMGEKIVAQLEDENSVANKVIGGLLELGTKWFENRKQQSQPQLMPAAQPMPVYSTAPQQQQQQQQPAYTPPPQEDFFDYSNGVMQ